MLPSHDFFDDLLAVDAGRITASNLLGGLYDGLYSKDFVWAVLVWWEALARFSGCKGVEIVTALGKLPDFVSRPYPPRFSPPATPVPDLHICCRRDRSSRGDHIVASVRVAQTLQLCGHRDDLDKLVKSGINLLSKPGTVDYTRSLQTSWNGHPHSIRLAPGKTLTNPALGKIGVLWFTYNPSLHARLKKIEHAKKADTARDILGLVHLDDTNLAIAGIPTRLTEERSDRGRPTFVEAGAHARFKSRTPKTTQPCWGRAVDLEKLSRGTPNVSGHLERVCGRVPPISPTPALTPLVMTVWFLGSPQIPRKDYTGVGDKEFADFIEGEIVEHDSGHRSLREQCLDLSR